MGNRKLFIGCSSEALHVAQRVKSVLKDPKYGVSNIEVKIWKDTEWFNFDTALTSLNNNIDEYYYAIFIGFPDSTLEEKRKDASSPGKFITNKYFATRDNTIFEFGLFFSRLGKDRTFFLNPKKIKGENEFKILTDVGESAYIIKYEIERNISGNWKYKDFDPTELLRFIKKEEKKFSNKNPTHNEKALNTIKLRISSNLGATDKNDEYYINKLKNELDQLLYKKTIATNISIKELTEDILNAINDVNDFCKPIHLAVKQSYKNKIKFIWVFSSQPFEFLPSNKTHILKIKEAVLENLKHGVKYTYFVSHTDFKLDQIDNLLQDVKDKNLRDNIEIIFVESKLFKTFFTLNYKKNYKLDSVYMSTLLKNRDDLLIQVTDDDHIKRIRERIQRLYGEHSTTNNIKTIDYTVE